MSTWTEGYDLGTIAGPDDCKKKCWRAKNLKFYYQTSKHENINGAQLESSSVGVYKCTCLVKTRGDIYPKHMFGRNVDQNSHFRVCKYDSEFNLDSNIQNSQTWLLHVWGRPKIT